MQQSHRHTLRQEYDPEHFDLSEIVRISLRDLLPDFENNSAISTSEFEEHIRRTSEENGIVYERETAKASDVIHDNLNQLRYGRLWLNRLLSILPLILQNCS